MGEGDAFAGIRVVDCTRGRAGSLAAMLLGDYGADVVKVIAPAPDEPPDMVMFGRGKRLIEGDPSALLAAADVAIFDDAPGAMAASRFNAQACAALNPHLVHAWMPPYGHAGEESELAPSQLLLSAMTAIAFRQGSYADQPVCLMAPLLHYGHGVLGAAAIAAALIARSRDGAGRSIRLSGFDACAQMNGASRDVGTAAVARPVGGGPNYRFYQCADGGWLFLGSLFEPFVTNARAVLGLGERPADLMIDEPNYLAAFKTKPRDEWLRLLREAGVPCAPAGEFSDWFGSEPVAANDLIVRRQHAALGEVAMPGLSAQLSATPGRVGQLLAHARESGWSARRNEPASAHTDAPPLAGLRVLDMGVVIAGAAAGAILANFGADVVKVEGEAGDPFRSSGLVSAAFNRGKRALAIDLKAPAGRAAFLEMAKKADVVLDNFRLGVRERLGLAYNDLRAVNRRIVSCSLTAYGRRGERAPWPGFDPLLQAESGLAQRQGGRGQEPVYHQMAVNDVASAAVTAFSILAALYAREKSGEGQEIVTSLTSQSVFYQAEVFTRYAGAPEPADGDRDCVGTRALSRFYPCRDGWIAIECVTHAEAEALSGVLGVVLADNALLAERHGAFANRLASAIAAESAEDLARRLRAAGVPAARARRAGDAYEDATLAANGYFTPYQHPDFGEVIGVTGYGAINGAPLRFTTRSPLLGEHTREVLGEFGFAAGAIDALLEKRAVFQR